MVVTFRKPVSVLVVLIIGIFVRYPEVQMIRPVSVLGGLFKDFLCGRSLIGRGLLVDCCGRGIGGGEKIPVRGLSLLGSISNSREGRMSGAPRVVDGRGVKLLNQNEAIQVDQDLFNEYKFSVDQLMELAGLSVATAVAQVYGGKKGEKVLIITGPGNNGGDGLVVARHLKLFGFENITILNARKPSKELYVNLLHQADMSGVAISYDAGTERQDASVGIIVDALFGFSFKPPVRPEFQPLVDIMVAASAKSIPVVAVDIPSGWDVEKGPPSDESIRFMPEMLVSLTAPKICASYFEGSYHFIGGRFVPKKLADKYSLNLPPYPGTDCIVRIK